MNNTITSAYDEEVELLYKHEILKHKNNKCDCDQENQTKPKCIVGQWLDGKIPSKQLVEDYHLNKHD